ncbi:MAG: SDR family oxidoreductase [Anaerolineales bacterium]|nr:SDR family oxidoreductase [Anaerolineales bacterium]
MEKKVAIVTAAGRGMGAACARELAAQGYAVALMSVSERAQTLAAELSGIGLQGSVTETADLNKLVAMTMGEYGRIDAVINNTGHPPKGDLLDITDDDWHVGLDLVLLNVVRMARLVVPIMQQQGGGAFVNISTFAAFEPSLSFPVSSALRAGLGSFTKLFADRYAAENIRMNNVLPGYIESYPVNDDVRETIPMGRAGTVDEVAKTAVFLLSDAAGYITGQNIRVDGGITRSV